MRGIPPRDAFDECDSFGSSGLVVEFVVQQIALHFSDLGLPIVDLGVVDNGNLD